MEKIYKQIGEVELALNMYVPNNWTANDRRAAILFFFGGGWMGGTVQQFKPQCEYFAAQGMVAFTADYRVKSRHGTTPFECVEDARDAIQWIANHASELGIDPERIVASGGSAGGHIAASTAIPIAGATSSLPDIKPVALVLFNPVLDTTETWVKSFADQEERFEELAKTLGPRGHELSCTHHVTDKVPPTLLFHGTEDTTVPYEQAVDFCKVMHEKGNPCQLVPFEGEEHGFFNYGRKENVPFQETLKVTKQFLEKLHIL